MRYARGRNWRRIAFLGSSDATGRDAERDFDQVLQNPDNAALKMVAREHFNPGDLSVGAQIERIVEAKPDLFLAWSAGTAIATMFKGLSNAGAALTVSTSNGNMTFEQMDGYAAFLPKQLYIASSVWPAGADGVAIDPGVDAAQKRFYAAFAAAGIVPDGPIGLPWDPAELILGVLRDLGPDTTAAQMRAALAATTDHAGIQGHYDFTAVPQRGLGAISSVVTRWNPQARRWHLVSHPGGTPLASPSP